MFTWWDLRAEDGVRFLCARSLPANADGSPWSLLTPVGAHHVYRTARVEADERVDVVDAVGRAPRVAHVGEHAEP